MTTSVKQIALVMCLVFLRPHCVETLKTSSKFRNFGAEPSGCENVFREQSNLGCAVSCKSDPQCRAFKFQADDKVCTTCAGENISNMTFSEQPFYFQRTQALVNKYSNSTDLYLRKSLTPGDMIYLSVTIYDRRGVILILNTNTYNTKVFHFRVRLPDHTIVLSSQDSSGWMQEHNFYQPFPFAEGKRTDIYVLMTQDRFMIYIDKIFCCQYMYVMPLQKTTTLRVKFITKVHELSI